MPQNQQGRDGGGPFTLTSILSKDKAVQPDRPETYRLPTKGGDPYFGLTRGWYYAAERDGLLRLVRLRKRGRQRGVTLVPYDDVAAIINSAKQRAEVVK